MLESCNLVWGYLITKLIIFIHNVINILTTSNLCATAFLCEYIYTSYNISIHCYDTLTYPYNFIIIQNVSLTQAG